MRFILTSDPSILFFDSYVLSLSFACQSLLSSSSAIDFLSVLIQPVSFLLNPSIPSTRTSLCLGLGRLEIT